jgi:hypothetical protein
VYNRAVQTAAASSQGTAPPGPQKVFFFDPSNPEEVQEVLVEPHVDIEAAEELLVGSVLLSLCCSSTFLSTTQT